MTTTMTIFASEIILLLIIFYRLSFNIIRLRRQHRIPIGNGDNHELQRAISAHDNFLNYVPLSLIIQLGLILTHVNIILFTIIAALLIVGRSMHMYSIIYAETKKANYRCRPISMIMTFISLFLGALLLLICSIS